MLPNLTSNSQVNPLRSLQNLQVAYNDLSAQAAILDLFYPDSPHLTQYGTITSGSKTITNLHFMPVSNPLTGTTTKGQIVVAGLTAAETANLTAGELVTGPGIQAGTTIASVGAQSINLSLVATASGTNQLTISDPIAVAPTFEYANVTKGSNAISGLTQQSGATGTVTQGSDTVTNLGTTANLAVGDTVTGTGIQPGTRIYELLPSAIPGDSAIVLTQNATKAVELDKLTFSDPLVVGEPVTGSGIPAGTTIASVNSTSTSITLSNNATASATGATLCFGSAQFAGPTVTAADGALPAGDSIASIVNGSSVTLSQPATQSGTVQLTLTLTPQEELLQYTLNNLLQQIAQDEANYFKKLGASFDVNVLLGGSGTDSLYAGGAPVWMVGTTGRDTFNITPANYAYFGNPEQKTNRDVVEGSKSGTDTLMFLGDGQINLSYNLTENADFPANADVVTIQNPSYNESLAWPEGNNIRTVGVQTMGGKDTVTIGSAKFGSWTSRIRVVDGGVPGNPALEGNVVINAVTLTEQASLLGGAGNDTIMIDNLATGSVVQGGTGNDQQNALDIIGESDAVFVREGTDPSGQEDLAIDGNTWLNVANFQNLVVVGNSQSGSTGNPQTNVVQTDGNLIPK